MTKTDSLSDQLGRVTIHSKGDCERYSSMTDEEKQEFLRGEYEERDATDPYATSRDNARELEILAIRKALREPGRVLDLGCGNGYTLLALGARLEASSWPASTSRRT